MPWRKINGEDQVWESGDDRRREQQPLEPSWLVQCWWLEWKLWWNRGHSDVLPSVIYDSNGPRILDRKNRSFRNYKEVKPVSVLREIFVAQTMLQMFQNLQILGISRCFMQQFTKLSRLFFELVNHFATCSRDDEPNGSQRSDFTRRCILVSTHCGVLSPWILGEQTNDRNTSPCIRCE